MPNKTSKHDKLKSNFWWAKPATRFLSVSICVYLWLISLCFSLNAQTTAPGAPGKDAQWATAGKQGVGTSANRESKVWFTLAQGVMTEVYYPDVTTANVHLLQFIVVNPKTKKVETEQDDAIHEIRVPRPDSLTFQQINTAKSGKWKITKTYITDTYRDIVFIDVAFQSSDSQLALYVQYDPSLGNSGMGDEGSVTRMSDCSACQFAGHHALTAVDKRANILSKLFFSSPISEIDSAFAGSDGIEQLRRLGKILKPSIQPGEGNIVQTARIDQPAHFLSVLAFGKLADDPTGSIDGLSFESSRTDYERGWANYVKTLPKVDPKYQAQFNMAAMQLKANEDKSHPGANVASLTIPWGGGANANENNVGGYHLVWSRDLYQVATAYIALGDTAAANRALDFVFNVQQKPDGSVPQNSFLDGRPFWGSLQMDEVAYPLILAWQLGRYDKPTYENHVKKAADFIVKNGPSTPQERWEERPGYSPSTIAAEIAGLVCAADIAKRNGDEASALIWLAAADDWARNVERWTATTNGKYGDGNYYIRISEKGEPDAHHKIELNNNAGTFDENEIVDAGFLELVRLGIKPADDPLIVKSLKVIDQQIKVDTPNGPAFYRYNHDGYGEMDDGRRWNWDGKYTGKGRLWALLSGERGQYELAECESKNAESPAKPQSRKAAKSVPPAVAGGAVCLEPAKKRLDAMLGFANEGLMIPEQVWDKKETPANVDKQFIPELKFGEGTGSATPLAWSMAQFIRLAVNLKAGRNLDTPQVVADRYRNGIPGQVSNFGTNDTEVILPLKTGESMTFPRQAEPGTRAFFRIGDKTLSAIADEKGQLAFKFEVPPDGSVTFGGVEAPDGSTAFERVTLRQTPRLQSFTPDFLARMRSATAAPLIDENGRAVLIYRGKAGSVTVAGDINGWNPNREFMREIEPGLWAIRLDLGGTARSEYKIVVDGKWILDPLNSRKQDNGVGGENNILEMPGYVPTPWTQFYVDGRSDAERPIWTKDVTAFDLNSRILNDTRQIKVYVPGFGDGHASMPPLPVLYLEDGGDYITRAKAVDIQQSLVEAGKVKPFIMVFLDPKEREKEYWANDKWADFVANEVVPEIDRRYKTIATRDGRATLGASLGGITSLWIGIKHPNKFARLGGQSSSFWVDNERVVRALEKLDPSVAKFRFYLDDGTLEGSADTRRVNVMLRGRGFPVTYVEGETGHNWTAWRDRLAAAFIALWQ